MRVGTPPHISSLVEPKAAGRAEPAARPARFVEAELQRVSREPPPLSLAPQALAETLPIANADPLSAAGLQVLQQAPVETAASAAEAEVSVDGRALRAEREGIVAETHAAVAALERDARAILQEARALQGEHAGVRVVYREEGPSRFAQITRLDGEGNPVSLREARLEDASSLVREIEREDASWLSTIRAASVAGSKQRFTLELECGPAGEGATSPLDESLFRRAKAGERQKLEVVIDGDVVERELKASRNEDLEGRCEWRKKAKVRFVEHPAGRVKLPGDIERAFDPGASVIERSATLKESKKGARDQLLLSERVFSQGAVRVTETGDGSAVALLLEEEVEAGRRKESQQFLRGTEKTVRTTTERVGETGVREVQRWIDTGGARVGGHDARLRPLRTVESEREYGECGRLATQSRRATDHVKGELRVDTFRRTEEGEQVFEDVALDVRAADGSSTKSTARQTLRVKDGVEELASLALSRERRALELTAQPDGIHYRSVDEATGKRTEGILSPNPDKGAITLRVNGKTVELPLDGRDAARVLREQLGPEELIGLDVALDQTTRSEAFLETFARSEVVGYLRHRVLWGMNIADRYELAIDSIDFIKDSIERLRNLIQRIATGSPVVPIGDVQGDVPGLTDQIGNGLQFISIGQEALNALNDFKRGDYFRGTLRSVRGATQVVQVGGRALGYFDAASAVGRGLRAGRAAVDVVQGGYDIAHGDTRYDRLEGGAKVATSAARVGLSITASSGPLAPYLFGGLFLFEGLKFAADTADKRYVVPLGRGLEFRGGRLEA